MPARTTPVMVVPIAANLLMIVSKEAPKSNLPQE